MSDALRICVAGLRGMPKVQGGVEAHCESLLPRIAARAPHFAITVISRQPYCDGGVMGLVRISPVWTVRQKHLEAIVHTGLAVLYAKVVHAKILHLHAIGPALWTPLACMLGMRVIVTHHGADYRRAKWGPLARGALRLGEWIAATRADAVIAVSSTIADDLRRRFPAHADRIVHIPNGADMPAVADEAIIERLGLQRGRFILSVGRLVPEKGFDDLIAAYQSAETDAPLVIAGGADHEDRYARRLRGAASQNVQLPGRLSRAELAALYRHCGLFVLASHHEGLPIAALEAMAAGARVLLSDIAANTELGLPDVCYFPVGNREVLAGRLSGDWSDLKPSSDHLCRFQWDDIAERTSAVYRAVAT